MTDEPSKFCPRCQRQVPLSGWYKNRARSDGLTGHCRECHLAVDKIAREKRRAKCLDALGGVCARCGFSDRRALQIDHTNGGGRAENKGQSTNTARFYDDVLARPDDFQLLCANCNVIKRIESEEHVGARVYVHDVPTERIKGPGRHNPEANARRAAGIARWRSANPEAERERAAKISATRTGLRKGPDGKMYRPE